MPLNSIYPNPVTIGSAEPGLDIPINQWWGIKAGVGQSTSWQAAYGGLLDRWFFDDTPELTAEEASKAYGIEGVLKFDKPIQEGAARDRREQTLANIRLSLFTESARHSGLSWKGISGFGAMMAGQMFNAYGPLNIDFGLSIFPFFGAEKTAAGAAQVGWRAALNAQKGFIRAPAAFLPKYPLFAESVLNGASGAAIGELATYLDARYKQEETNYLGGVAMGAAGAGIFHAGVRGIFKGLGAAGRALKRFSPDTLEAAEHIANEQAVRGEDIRPLDHAPTDENVIRLATMPENAANANELLILARIEAEAPTPSGKIAARLLERFADGERSVDLFDQIAQLTDRKYRPDKPSPADESISSGLNREEKPLREELFQIESVSKDIASRLDGADPLLARQLRANLHNLQLRRAEIFEVLEKREAEKPLTPQELAQHRAIIEARPENRTAMADAREQRVLDYVKRNDPETVKQREKAAAQRQAAESARDTDNPEADRWEGDEDKQLAEMKEDISALEREMADPKALETVNKQFDTATKPHRDLEAAQKAAIDCMIKNGIG